LKVGKIQKNIESAANQRRENVATGKLKLLGTNHFPDNKPAPEGIDLKKVFFHKKAIIDNPEIEPIVSFRAAEAIEKQRLADEKQI
jgi:methylmalonyl-CoA mutase N-terminal domain/subunit